MNHPPRKPSIIMISTEGHAEISGFGTAMVEEDSSLSHHDGFVETLCD
jgi:hypothetical protein